MTNYQIVIVESGQDRVCLQGREDGLVMSGAQFCWRTRGHTYYLFKGGISLESDNPPPWASVFHREILAELWVPLVDDEPAVEAKFQAIRNRFLGVDSELCENVEFKVEGALDLSSWLLH